MNASEVLAIIPARGGSKGLPHKNIMDLGGKPLVAHSIDAALRSELITRVVVSTDDQEIADVALKYGAEVPFLRPSDLANDTMELWPAVKHLLEWLQREEGYVPDAHAVLLPTSPFRTPAMLDHLVGKFHEGFATIYTVKKVAGEAFYFQNADNGGLTMLNDVTNQNGAEYVRKLGTFYGVSGHKGAYGDYMHLLENPVEHIDIDFMSDLRTAQSVLEQNLYRL